jgi:hypothetical protein
MALQSSGSHKAALFNRALYLSLFFQILNTFFNATFPFMHTLKIYNFTICSNFAPEFNYDVQATQRCFDAV